MELEAKVWKTSHKVQVNKLLSGVWEAVGEYLGKEIKVTAADEESALRAWVSKARSRGV